MKNILLSFLFLLCISCSDSTSPKNVDKYLITSILEDIETAFSFDDIERIMNHYHPNFLHNENNFNDEYAIWEIRLLEYDEIEFTEIEISINDNFASAEFVMKLSSGEDFVIYNEPDDNGDISYFYYDLDAWKICGNNFSVKKD